jgi:hypothetical protein
MIQQRFEDLQSGLRVTGAAPGHGEQEQGGWVVGNCLENFLRLFGGKYRIDIE